MSDPTPTDRPACPVCGLFGEHTRLLETCVRNLRDRLNALAADLERRVWALESRVERLGGNLPVIEPTVHGSTDVRVGVPPDPPVTDLMATLKESLAKKAAPATEAPAVPSYGPGRCEICGWTLASSAKKGCVPGNCSYRPPNHSPEHRRIRERRAALGADKLATEAPAPSDLSDYPDGKRRYLDGEVVQEEPPPLATEPMRNIRRAAAFFDRCGLPEWWHGPVDRASAYHALSDLLDEAETRGAASPAPLLLALADTWNKTAASPSNTWAVRDAIRRDARELRQAVAQATGQVSAKAEAPAPTDERIYPCDDCGLMRSKAEGGTTFTVCEECWDKAYGVDKGSPQPAPQEPSAVEAPPSYGPERCEVCGWTLSASLVAGCVKGNCSYRPPPGTPEHRRIKERRAALAAQKAAPSPAVPPLVSLHALAMTWDSDAETLTCARELREALAKLPESGAVERWRNSPGHRAGVISHLRQMGCSDAADVLEETGRS